MNGYRSHSLNMFWFSLVFIHLVGSVIIVFCLSQSWGMIFLNSILWGYLAWANRKKKLGIFLPAVGWSVNLFLLTHMPLGFSSSMIMNLFLLTYLLYLHFGSFPLMKAENQIKGIQGIDFGMILILTILFLIISGYVNAMSMLFVHNYVKETLMDIRSQLPAGILVLALLPAVVEELTYRGFIFQRLGFTNKAVVISALLFSLRHMNVNQMCYAFVMGLLLGKVYQTCRNLTVTTMIHFLFNLFSVLTAAFADSGLVKSIIGLQIGGYHLFHPFAVTLRDEAGQILTMRVGIGAGLSILCLILSLFLLERWKKKGFQKQGEIIKEMNWKPDYLFYLATFVCILSGILKG